MSLDSYKKQQGAVLLWALIILLVLTVLSLSSVRNSNTNTKIAGNSMASMMVFQGVESTISKIANTNYIDQASRILPDRKKTVPSLELPNEAVNGGSLSSTGSVAYVGYIPCPVMNDIAISTNASQEGGSVSCQVYEVEAESRLLGTGAKASHLQGIAVMAPPNNAAQ